MSEKGYKIDNVDSMIAELKAKKSEILTMNHNIIQVEKIVVKEKVITTFRFDKSDLCGGVEKKIDEIITRLEFVKQINEADTARLLQLTTLDQNLGFFTDLIYRYASHLKQPSGMYGYPGGGWNHIAVNEKYNLAKESGNAQAVLNLAENLLELNPMSEDELSQLISREIMNPEFQKQELERLGEEAYITQYYGTGKYARERYLVGTEMKSLIDREVQIQYGDIVGIMDPSKRKDKLKSILQSQGIDPIYFEHEYKRSGEAGIWKKLKGIEASKIMASLALSQHVNNERKELATLTGIPFQELGAKHTSKGLNETIRKIGDSEKKKNAKEIMKRIEQYGFSKASDFYNNSTYNINTGVTFTVQPERIKSEIEEVYSLEFDGMIQKMTPGEQKKRFTFLRAQNTLVTLPDELPIYSKESGMVVDEKPESSTHEVSKYAVVTRKDEAKTQLDKAKADIDKAADGLASTIIDSVLPFVPTGKISTEVLKSAKDLAMNFSKNWSKTDDFFIEFNKFATENGKEYWESNKGKNIKNVINGAEGIIDAGRELWNAQETYRLANENFRGAITMSETEKRDGYVIIDGDNKVTGYSPKGVKR